MTTSDPLPSRQRWATAIGDDPAAISSLSTPVLRKDQPIAVMGGALAAALVAPLTAAGFQPIAADRRHPILADLPGEDPEYEAFGNGHGEIHSTRAFRQLIERAARTFAPVEDRWHEDGRVVDAFRPNLRYPAASDQEFDVLQTRHLNTVRAALRRADIVLVALSTSEIWEARADGAAFPHWGDGGERRFDAERHQVRVLTVEESVADLTAAAAALRGLNPAARIVAMISPEPQPATASPHHVVAAAALSKAVLRIALETAAQAGELGYFPALEIAGVGAPAVAYPAGGGLPDAVARAVSDALLAVSEGGGVAFTEAPAVIPALTPAATQPGLPTAPPTSDPADLDERKAARARKSVAVTIVDPYTLARAAEEKDKAAKREAKAAAGSLRDEERERKRAEIEKAREAKAAVMQSRKDLRAEKHAQMLALRQAKVAAREAKLAKPAAKPDMGTEPEPNASIASPAQKARRAAKRERRDGLAASPRQDTAAPAGRKRRERAPAAAKQAVNDPAAAPAGVTTAERKERRRAAKATATSAATDGGTQTRRGRNAKRRSSPGRVPPNPS